MRVVATEESEVKQHVEVIAIEKWRGIVGRGAWLRPHNERVARFTGLDADIAGCPRLDGEDGSRFVADVAGADVKQAELREWRGNDNGRHAAEFPKQFAVEIVRADTLRAARDELGAL